MKQAAMVRAPAPEDILAVASLRTGADHAGAVGREAERLDPAGMLHKTLLCKATCAIDLIQVRPAVASADGDPVPIQTVAAYQRLTRLVLHYMEHGAHVLHVPD